MSVDEVVVYIFASYFAIFLAILTLVSWLLAKKFPAFWRNYLLFLGVFSLLSIPVIIAVVGEKFYERMPATLFKHHFGVSSDSKITDLEGEKKSLPGLAYADFLKFKTNRETIQNLSAGNYEEVSEQSTNIKYCEKNIEAFSNNPKVHFYNFRQDDETEEDRFLALVQSKSLAYNEETNEAFFCWYRDDW